MKASRVGLLAHPVVVASLVGWIVNDRILKARFGNVATGKLSDAFAMVVFPLLVAVVLQRWTRRPIEVAMGITLVFFSAINLSAVISAATESALDLVMPSSLWPDPTDLVVLPLLVVSHWLWHHGRTWGGTRNTWGRLVFTAGAVVCLATSSAEPVSENSFSGRIVLTAENPERSFPVDFTIEGQPADPMLNVGMTVLAFGDALDGASGVVTKSIVPLPESAVVFTLTDPAAGPVEVSFDVQGYGTINQCGLFNFGCDSDEQVPTLDMEPPPQEDAETAVEMIELGGGDDDTPIVLSVDVVAENTTTLRLGVRDDRYNGRPAEVLTILDESGSSVLHEGRSLDILPDDCLDSCSFRLTLIAADTQYSAVEALFFGEGTVEITQAGVDLNSTVREFDLPFGEAMRAAVDREKSLCVETRAATSDFDAATTFVKVRGVYGDDRDDGTYSISESRPRPLSDQVAGCVVFGDVTILGRGDPERIVFSIELWSTAPLGGNQITVSFVE